MTPEALANLHAAAFHLERAWSAKEFADLLNSPLCHLTTASQGFALWRAVADEAELLTIATHPDYQRRGIGAKLMKKWMAAANAVAQTAFLEVAADNTAAITLYERHNFEQAARRRNYYTRRTTKVDALIMRARLPLPVAQ